MTPKLVINAFTLIITTLFLEGCGQSVGVFKLIDNRSLKTISPLAGQLDPSATGAQLPGQKAVSNSFQTTNAIIATQLPSTIAVSSNFKVYVGGARQ